MSLDDCGWMARNTYEVEMFIFGEGIKTLGVFDTWLKAKEFLKEEEAKRGQAGKVIARWARVPKKE